MSVQRYKQFQCAKEEILGVSMADEYHRRYFPMISGSLLAMRSYGCVGMALCDFTVTG